MENPKDFLGLISYVEMRHLINSSMGTSGIVVDDLTHTALYAFESAEVNVEAKLLEISKGALLYYQSFKERQAKADKQAAEEAASLEDERGVSHDELKEVKPVQHIPDEHLTEPNTVWHRNLREPLKGREISDREFKCQFGNFSQFSSCTCVRDVLIVLRTTYNERWMKELQERM